MNNKYNLSTKIIKYNIVSLINHYKLKICLLH